jgi:hypothetical protein
MGWFIVLAGIVLLVVVTRKTLDHETTRNLKFLSKIVAALAGLIFLSVLVSHIIH